MVDPGTANRGEQPTVAPRWVGLGFAVFALALLAYALAYAPPAAVAPLAALAVAAPALGLLSASRGRAARLAAVGALVACVGLAFAAVAASGGAGSPLWPALIPALFGGFGNYFMPLMI
ncbi:MAG TPA: hypothetical protein PKD53_33210, partial [Chloroflexaceae bacterium]|nr:hypothetical protein [Chloroflexaceae bacterium]